VKQNRQYEEDNEAEETASLKQLLDHKVQNNNTASVVIIN